MKIKCCFYVFVVFVAEVYSYTTHTDNLDIEGMMENDEHHKRLMHCVLEKITCMEVTQNELDIVQEALKTQCEQCTDLQKSRFKQFLFKSKSSFPEEYVIFKQKYDPQNNYLDKFEKYINQF